MNRRKLPSLWKLSFVIRMCCEYRSWESLSVSVQMPVALKLVRHWDRRTHQWLSIRWHLLVRHWRRHNAIVWALGRFRDLIFGSRKVIFCDHNPLQYIRENLVRNCCGGNWRWPKLIWKLNILRIVRMLWLIICHECEVTTLYVVSCECDSFRGVPNCRCSLMNCYLWALSTSALCARWVLLFMLCCHQWHSDVFCIVFIDVILVCLWICDFMRCV